MKTVARVRDGEFGITAVDRVAGKLRVVAEILALRSTIAAVAIGPAEPRNTDSVSDCKLWSLDFGIWNFHDASDDLVAEDVRQLAIDDVEIGAADRAGGNAHQQLAGGRSWLWHVAERERFSRFIENHRDHLTMVNRKSDYRNPKRRSDCGGLTNFALVRLGRGFVLVIMGAAQEGHFVEEMFLEPFEPEINHRRHEERHHLGEDQTADNYEPERTSRRSILTEAEREWDCTHQRGECRHHDRTKTFDARFVDGRTEVPAFIDSRSE